MKILRKICIALVVSLVILFLLTYTFFKFGAKGIIISQLKKKANLEVSIDDLSISPFLNIKVKGLKVPELAEVDFLSLSPNPLGLLTGRVVLNNLTIKNSSFTLERFKDGSFNLPVQKKYEVKSKKEPVSDKPKKNNRFILLGLDITDTKFIFKDKKTAIDNFIINSEDIDVHIKKSSLLTSDLTIKFKASGVIYGLNPEKKGSFNSDGWINLTKKDMDGNFSIKSADCAIIIPYLGSFFSAERIKDGIFNVGSTLKAVNNDLTVTTKLDLENIAKAALAKDTETPLGALVAGEVLDWLRDETDKASATFIYKAKLDSPFNGRFDVLPIAGQIAGQFIQKKVLEPLKGNLTVDKIKEVGKDFEDIGKKFKEGLKQIEEGIKKDIEP